LAEHIHFQLPFLSVITESNQLFHISIGEKVGQKALDKVAKRINTHMQEYNIVILSNIEVAKPAKSKKTDEQNKIAKIIQTYSAKTPLLTLFQKILSAQKKKSEMVAYVNPGDFSKS
jgi:uncharacterized protein YabN with tetrapyrrole methylase and pyrophosphatase domain